MLDMSPEQKARLLAISGYDKAAITKYLREEGVEDAASLAAIIIGQQTLTEQENARTIERGQRAVAAEHDLSRTTWR